MFNVVRFYLGWFLMEWFWSGSDLKILVYKKKKFWELIYIDFDYIFWFIYIKVLVFFGVLSVWCICGDYVCYMELVILVMYKFCNCEVF